MLTLDLTLLTQVVNSAKLAAGDDTRWQHAIDRAARELVENPYVEAMDDHTLLIASSTSTNIYSANGICQCEAFKFGRPCWHRAASRLYQRYTEAQANAERRARWAAAQREIEECFA